MGIKGFWSGTLSQYSNLFPDVSPFRFHTSHWLTSSQSDIWRFIALVNCRSFVLESKTHLLVSLTTVQHSLFSPFPLPVARPMLYAVFWIRCHSTLESGLLSAIWVRTFASKSFPVSLVTISWTCFISLRISFLDFSILIDPHYIIWDLMSSNWSECSMINWNACKIAVSDIDIEPKGEVGTKRTKSSCFKGLWLGQRDLSLNEMTSGQLWPLLSWPLMVIKCLPRPSNQWPISVVLITFIMNPRESL